VEEAADMTASSHLKQTFGHALVYGGSSILARAIGFIMLPFYAHYLRGEGYGIIGMIDVALGVLTIFVGYGIRGAMARFYFEREREKDRQVLVSTTLFLMFAMVAAVSAPVLVFPGPISAIVFGKEGLSFYLILATLAFICEMTSKTAEAYILIRQKPFLVCSLAIGKLFLGLSLNIYLIVHLELGVLGYLYANLITGAIFTVIMHGYVISQVGLRFSKTVVREILAFSLPLLPGYLAMFFKSNADRVILRSHLGLAQLGAYEMLFKFATLIGLFIVEPLSKSWNVKRLEICDTPEGPGVISHMFTLQVALMVFAGLILALQIPLLLQVLTPQEFWLGGGVALLAVITRILNAAANEVNFGFNYAKKTKGISYILIPAAVLNVLLNLILIPKFGILGALLTSCLVNMMQGVLGYYMARGYYSIPFQWAKIWQICILGVVLFLILKNVSIRYIGLGPWVEHSLAPTVEEMLRALHLDQVKDGKLLNYVVTKLPILLDGLIQCLLSLVFLPALVIMDVIPRENVRRILQTINLRHPFRAFSES
jgi:O-antigen/teichoic acid export membrane protein